MSAETLDELVALARKDLYEGRAGAAVEWMAFHARARGEAARADRALQDIEWRERDIRIRTTGAYMANEERLAIIATGPASSEVRNAEDLYAEATERVVFTEHVLGVLTSRFGRSTEAPMSKRLNPEPRPEATKPVPRFGAIKGGKR